MKNNRHKIIAGLREAISYAKGDQSRGRSALSLYSLVGREDFSEDADLARRCGSALLIRVGGSLY